MKNRLCQTESHRPTKYSLRMGLNSGKIKEETARLYATSTRDEKVQVLTELRLELLLVFLVTQNMLKCVFREEQLVKI